MSRFSLNLLATLLSMTCTHLRADEATRSVTLNGAAGTEGTRVETGLSRRLPNSLMLTGLIEGQRRTAVAGGEFFR
jgi:hypothetical protein